MRPIRPMVLPGIRCSCGGELTVRHRHMDRKPFLGCTRYPDCNQALGLTDYPRLVEAILLTGIQRSGLEAVTGLTKHNAKINDGEYAIATEKLFRLLIGFDPDILEGDHDAQAAACLACIADAWLVCLETTRPGYFGKVLTALHGILTRRMANQPSETPTATTTRKPKPHRGLVARLTEET